MAYNILKVCPSRYAMRSLVQQDLVFLTVQREKHLRFESTSTTTTTTNSTNIAAAAGLTSG